MFRLLDITLQRPNSLSGTGIFIMKNYILTTPLKRSGFQLIFIMGLISGFLIPSGHTFQGVLSATPTVEPEDVGSIYNGLDFSEPVIYITDANRIRITEPDQVVDCQGAVLEGERESGELISVIKTSGAIIMNCGFQGSTEAAVGVYESDDIVIQNNTFTGIQKPPGMDYGGFSILVKGGADIIIKDNVFDNNQIGIMIEGEPDDYVDNVRIEGNTVANTWMSAAIKCRRCRNVIVSNNELDSNGRPEYFERQRIVGIDLHQVDDARVYGNTVIESSSDGIGVPGEVWEEDIVYSTHIEIYDNTVIGNGEQGIWAIAGKDINIHDNIIYCTKHCYTGCSGVFFEWDVSDSRIFDNHIYGRGDKHNGITIKNSHSNRIADNIIENIGIGIYVEEVAGKQSIGDQDAVLNYVAPVNNVIVNNDIDAVEFMVLDNANNVVEDNRNRRKIMIGVYIGASILAVVFFIAAIAYYRITRKK